MAPCALHDGGGSQPLTEARRRQHGSDSPDSCNSIGLKHSSDGHDITGTGHQNLSDSHDGMYLGLWLLSARHVSTLLHPHCTPRPSPYVYKRKVQGSHTRRLAARENGLSDSLSLSHSPSRTLVTPYCKRTRPGRRTTRRPQVPLLLFSPLRAPSRADPSGLGHATAINSSVQGPPRVETPIVGAPGRGLLRVDEQLPVKLQMGSLQ
jgi:hypothetical protein